jgi:NAD(P)-dependent dehydrogenase (short-subunit alcohol dehydrogenase family)
MMSVRNRNLSSNLNVQGRQAVVVGATSGIGEACALRLAEAGYSVTAVGRDPKRGENIVNAMKSINDNNNDINNNNDKMKNEYDFISCDAFGLKNIEKCAQDILQKKKKIDVLVMSQGMATIQGFTPTSEGNDQKLTLHYCGRMAMITQLLPSLRQSPDPRVVSILSGGVHSPFAGFKEDPELKNMYSIKNAADTAGFYNDLGLDALAHQPENKDILFVHAAPGFVNTNWGTEMPWFIRYPVRMLQPLGRSAADCAEAMCFPCLASKKDIPSTLSETASSSSSSSSGVGADDNNGQLENNVLIMGPQAQRARKTSLHSKESRDFVWKQTVDVLERAGVSPFPTK